MRNLVAELLESVAHYIRGPERPKTPGVPPPVDIPLTMRLVSKWD